MYCLLPRALPCAQAWPGGEGFLLVFRRRHFLPRFRRQEPNRSRSSKNRRKTASGSAGSLGGTSSLQRRRKGRATRRHPASYGLWSRSSPLWCGPTVLCCLAPACSWWVDTTFLGVISLKNPPPCGMHCTRLLHSRSTHILLHTTMLRGLQNCRPLTAHTYAHTRKHAIQITDVIAELANPHFAACCITHTRRHKHTLNHLTLATPHFATCRNTHSHTH